MWRKRHVFFNQPQEVSSLPDPDIMIDGLNVECSTDFCYLGSHVSTDLSITRELRSRVSKAATAFGRLERRVWKNRNLQTRTKLAVYKSMVLSVLLYGSETWTLYKRDVRYLDRFHLQCLRRILGIQWSDKVPNADVLLRASAQGMESMLVWNQLRWVGHVCRMDDQRIPKQLLYGQLKLGKRKPGRQKLRYQDAVKINLCNLNLFPGLGRNRQMIGLNGGRLCGLELTSINNYELIKVRKNVPLGRQQLLHRLQ